MCTTLKLPSIHEKLCAIIVVDQIVESLFVVLDNPLEIVFVGHKRDEDTKAQEIKTCLNLASRAPHNRRVEPLEHELETSPKPSIEQAQS